jgi:subtilase family serine protease
MKPARWAALAGSVGLAVSFAAAVTPSASASAKPLPARISLRGSMAPAVARSHPDGAVSASSSFGFDLVLSLRNTAGAQAFVKAVSEPGSAQFHHYLSDAQWSARFGPTRAEVAKAESWLRSAGFSVTSVPRDRLYVAAQGTAKGVEHAFGVQLGYYKVNGKRVRLATGNLSIPSSMAGTVTGVMGVNEEVATTDLSQVSHAPAHVTASPTQEPGPPAGFANPEPCSAYWGQKTDTADSTQLYAPYKGPLPYDICGYKSAQLRGAYGLAGSVAKGDDGSGVTMAIVDAYDSPTLLSDAQEYFTLNDPSHPLQSSQFTNVEPAKVTNVSLCGGSGWYPEQALDVESSHSMAPGANVEFVGAESCLNTDLLNALQTAVTSGASVVSDSWGDDVGDLLDDAATKTVYDNTFMMADSTGVSVLFSSGDDGDNFADFGLDAANYPPSSPYITAVGGTTLEVGAHNTALAQYGWSTGKQLLCGPVTAKNCGSATTPEGSLAFQSGGGGGTSYYYTQPYYQAGIVPSALALRNEAVNGPVPYRVEPDISMDADAQSGFLIGFTQAFPNGTYYAQFKEGGTSLASPLLAGVIADADQAAGSSLGFLNPELYSSYTKSSWAFNDIVPQASPLSTAVIRVDYANTQDASDGYLVSMRTITYAGPETYCDGTGNCATRNVTLTTGKGYDSLTGLGSIGSKFIAAMKKF